MVGGWHGALRATRSSCVGSTGLRGSERIIIETLHDLERRGVNIKSLTEPMIDTTTPMGRALYGIVAVFAQLRVDTIRENTMRGLAYAPSEGRVGGRGIWWAAVVQPSPCRVDQHELALCGARLLTSPTPRGSREAWMVTTLVHTAVPDRRPVTGSDDAHRAAWIPANSYPDLVTALDTLYGRTANAELMESITKQAAERGITAHER